MREWPKLLIASVTLALVALKCLLIPAYTSTDFEVHRNWMALTWQKPLIEWYTENTSEWTLDYPPLFAYFEWILANLADAIGVKEALRISAKSVFNDRILYFQRSSVIITDMFYIFACALYCFNSPRLVEKIPDKLKMKARKGVFVMLSCLHALLLVDSIHFQYNSFLTSIFMISAYFIDKRCYKMGAFVFSILINFKHIYVYYALGYAAYYLVNYFDLTRIRFFFTSISDSSKFASAALFLALAILIPCSLSFAPFFYLGGISSIQDIFTRLFPVSRGLTHAFWAPNFWALYNFADLVLYRVLRMTRFGADLVAPTYTSGLVQEYSHSVLPNVSPLGTLCLVVFASVLALASLRHDDPASDGKSHFSRFATLSSLAFFFFGYHVHEKAIILVLVPLTILAVKNLNFLRHLVLLSTIASFSLFPLLFTPFEVLVKYSICSAYLLLQLFTIKKMTRLPISAFLPMRNSLYFLLLVTAEIYNTFIHKFVVGKGFEFLPLMCISVLNALGVASCFYSLVWSTCFDGALSMAWTMTKCRYEEEKIKRGFYSVQTIDDSSEVETVAGVDVSASKTNSDLVVVTMSVFRHQGDNSGSVGKVATFSEVSLLDKPYIPQYLAARESDVVASFVRRICTQYPEYRPDVLFCDGYGQFHSRGCGMACHVGAKTGIASIGVAKKLALEEAYQVWGDEKRSTVDTFVENARKISKENENAGRQGFIPFDIVEPCKMNILRMGPSSGGVFVSAGYGIELIEATKIALHTLDKKTTCEPIRAADLASRDLVRRYFD